MHSKSSAAIGNVLLLSALCLAASGCMGGLTIPSGCRGASYGQACDQPSPTAKSEVYVRVTNARNGNTLVDARVEIIEGANAGTWCVTRVGGMKFGETPGCFLGELAPWDRKVRVTKDGFRPSVEMATGPNPGSWFDSWTFELVRQ